MSRLLFDDCFVADSLSLLLVAAYLTVAMLLLLWVIPSLCGRMALSRLEKQQQVAAGSDSEDSPDRLRERESSRSPSPTRLSTMSSASSMADIAVRAGLFGGAHSNSISSTGQLRSPYVGSWG